MAYDGRRRRRLLRPPPAWVLQPRANQRMQGIHALGDGRFRAEPRIRHGLPDHLSRAIRLQPDVVFKVFFLLIAGANALVFETKMADRLLALQPGEASTGADPLAESNDPNDSNDPNVFL